MHPDKIIFVDEVGSNTSQTKDSHYREEKNLVLGGAARSQQSCAQKDAHFTVLGFMASTVEPLMRAVIVTAKELEYGWVQGLMDLQTGWGRILPLIKYRG